MVMERVHKNSKQPSRGVMSEGKFLEQTATTSTYRYSFCNGLSPVVLKELFAIGWPEKITTGRLPPQRLLSIVLSPESVQLCFLSLKPR